MSTVQLGLCWPLILDPSAKAVLVSLADQANDDGDCYPAIASIAMRTCLSERTVQEALKRLQQRGLLEVAKQASRRRTNLFRLTLDGADCPRAESLAVRRARERKERAQELQNDRTDLVPTPQQLHPAAAAPRSSCTLDPAAAAPEPSVEPNTSTPIPPAEQGADGTPPVESMPKPMPAKQREGGRRRTVLCLTDWLAQCKAQGVMPVPEDDPVWLYAEQVGLSREMVALAWRAFKARRKEQKKGQADWRATFRNAVRGNWERVWYIPAGGEPVLTTVGEQLRREWLASEEQASERRAGEGQA